LKWSVLALFYHIHDRFGDIGGGSSWPWAGIGAFGRFVAGLRKPEARFFSQKPPKQANKAGAFLHRNPNVPDSGKTAPPHLLFAAEGGANSEWGASPPRTVFFDFAAEGGQTRAWFYVG